VQNTPTGGPPGPKPQIDEYNKIFVDSELGPWTAHRFDAKSTITGKEAKKKIESNWGTFQEDILFSSALSNSSFGLKIWKIFKFHSRLLKYLIGVKSSLQELKTKEGKVWDDNEAAKVIFGDSNASVSLVLTILDPPEEEIDAKTEKFTVRIKNYQKLELALPLGATVLDLKRQLNRHLSNISSFFTENIIDLSYQRSL
jgi:hypothetical protein